MLDITPTTLALTGPQGRWAVLDFETTGLEAPRVVEVALVASDGEVLLHTLVRPPCPIPADATEVHGITDDDVADAPTWAEVAPLLARAVAELDTLVAFRDRYERLVLETEGTPLGATWWDAQAACRGRVVPNEDGWISLRSACAQLGISAEPTHRAVDDCVATAALVFALTTPRPDCKVGAQRGISGGERASARDLAGPPTRLRDCAGTVGTLCPGAVQKGRFRAIRVLGAPG